MKIELKRFEFGDTYTVGRLYVNGVYECYTLEGKVPSRESIPTGTYDVIVTYSKEFKRYLPSILGNPNREDTRIRMGNSSLDTEGCILLGTDWAGTDWVRGSQLAFEPFLKEVLNKLSFEDVTITIT
jgi:hypothetical protein